MLLYCATPALRINRTSQTVGMNFDYSSGSICGGSTARHCLLEPECNDFDALRGDHLVHIPSSGPPWKTGLPVDYTLRESGLNQILRPIKRLLTPRYTSHPDPNQEAYFYALLAEAVDCGSVGRAEVERAVTLRHVRPDSPALIDRYRGRLWPAERLKSVLTDG